MEFEGGGPVLKPLLFIGGASSRMGKRKELLPFPDGRPALEHALETLYSTIPSAGTIYISLHDQSQLEGIQSVLDALKVKRTEHTEENNDHHHTAVPNLELVFDDEGKDIGPAAGLLAAHNLFPAAKWLVLACDYPLLPPPALQQLILEYQDPFTCFQNESGFAEPLIAIWGPEALGKLKENERSGIYGLNQVVEAKLGKLVRPLREEWITRTHTKEEWDEAMEKVASLVKFMP